MRELILYTVSGLTTAGIYAISASGLTLTYTTTGVFNFAHGAIGMVAAFAYWQLRYAWGVPTVLAFAVVLLVAAPLVGLGVERAVMRRLHDASEATKLMVTVALMLGLMSFALWVWNPGTARSVRPLWSGDVVEFGIVRVSYNDLLVLGVAASVAIGLRLLLYSSRAGIAMRAGVDDRDLALLTGAQPIRSTQLAWVVGTMLAALAGILVAPKLSLSPLPLTLLIVNAYAAAVIGRLRSLPMTFVGAIVLGLLNDYTIGYLPKIGTGQQYLRGLLGVTPAAVLLTALLVIGGRGAKATAARRQQEVTPRPSLTGTLGLGAATIGATIVLSTVLSAGDLFNITKMWGLALIALSMVPLVGYAGKLSLCPLSFGAIGAVVAAHVGTNGNPVALLIAPVVAGAVGAIVALPALRLSGIYLALSTAAFAVTLDRWVFQLPSFTVLGHRFSLFHTGSLTLRRPRIGPLDLAGDQAFFVAGAVVFAGCALLVAVIRSSRYGERLLALRDSPAASASIGISPRLTTLSVFMLSAAMAGLGGAVYAMGLRSASTGQFEFLAGVAILLAAVVGGIRSIGSAVFVGAFLGGPTLANLFPHLSQITSMSIALSAIAIGTNPNGIVGDALRPLWTKVWATPRLLVAGAFAAASIWMLRLFDVLDNWGWALATLAVIALLPALTKLVDGRRVRQIVARPVVHHGTA